MTRLFTIHARGFVSQNLRVELCLAACPDVTVKEINPDWEFIVMACDGIWDVLTSEVSRSLTLQMVPQFQTGCELF